MKQPPSKMQPDAPPAFRRALRLGWLEGIGVPALALLPALAIFGQLGPSTARTTASTLVGPDRVELSVVHPSVVRHRGLAELVVSVRNTGSHTLDDLRVGIDESYLARFSQADMLPAPESVTSGHIEVAIPPLRAGEQAHVRVRLEAGDWGSVDGAVRVNNGEHAPLASLKVSTWVLP